MCNVPVKARRSRGQELCSADTVLWGLWLRRPVSGNRHTRKVTLHQVLPFVPGHLVPALLGEEGCEPQIPHPESRLSTQHPGKHQAGALSRAIYLKRPCRKSRHSCV